MLCNQAPVLLTSGSQSTNHSAALDLQHFLNQYMSNKEPKFHTIQETLHKAESHGFAVQSKLDKGLNLKHPDLYSHPGSSLGVSCRTLDSTLKDSPQFPMTPTDKIVQEPQVDETEQQRNSKDHRTSNLNKVVNEMRMRKLKSKTTMDAQRLEEAQARHTRYNPSSFNYRSRTPTLARSHTSCPSDNINNRTVVSQNSAQMDGEQASISDEEEHGGFLMIKPITSEAPLPKQDLPNKKNQNFTIKLEDTLFPKEIIDYANSLQEPNLVAYMRTLIEFIYSFRYENPFFSTKRPVSEALYSIYFEGETLETFKKLLQQVLEKLKEESITLKQKYRSEIEYVQTKHLKISKSTAKSIKFEEKELQKLNIKISNILHERCLMDSQSVLDHLHHFLNKILERFPSASRPNALKSGKNIVIDYITLPKLMERLLESSSTWSTFYKTIIIYTYDLYVNSQNLMLYLVQRFFDPEPLGMTASELRVYRSEVLKQAKLDILRTIKFWIDERSGDFTRNPALSTILATFLDLAKPLEKENEILEGLHVLYDDYEKLMKEVQDQKRKISLELSSNNTPYSGHPSTKSDMSLLAKVISNSESITNCPIPESLTIKSARSMTKPITMTDFTGPMLAKNDSATTTCNTVRTYESGKHGPASISNYFWTGLLQNNNNKERYDYKMMLQENSEEIAKHLTLIDWKYFSNINISEMIQKRWTKGDKSECPRYFKYVRRFNSFCSWIQYIVLSQESFKRRMEIVEKFLEIAVNCLAKYNNYCSSHYIFAAVSSLEKYGVISLQEPLSANYEELKKTFIQTENFLGMCKEIFGAMKVPAIPNLNFFLQSFLKLQDGVEFWVKLPESTKCKYLKFPLLTQINEMCKEMRRFQKSGYDSLVIQKNDRMEKFLKKGFKKGVPVKLEDKDEAMSKLNKMVGQVKEKQNNLFNFFGVKTATKSGGL